MHDEQTGQSVSALDIVFLRKHILGIQALGSPYRLIAADANNSESISALDIVELRKVILGISTQFNNNTSWRFVPSAHVFADPTDPWAGAGFPEHIVLTDLGPVPPTPDFVAIKVGDVNASFTGGLASTSTEGRNAAPWPIRTPEQQLEPGLTYRVTLTAADTEALLGFQAALRFDTDYLRYTGWASGTNDLLLPHHLADHRAARGELRLQWDAQRADQWIAAGDLLTLEFTALRAGRLSEVLHLHSDALPSESYTGDWYAPTIAQRPWALEFTAPETPAFELLQNTPNPFSTRTRLGFRLGRADTATLRVYDTLGRLVWQHEARYPAGTHYLDFDLAAFPRLDGLLYYELRVPGKLPQTRRMVIE